MMTELEQARKILFETDVEMAKCFENRMDAVRTIAAYKKAHGLPVEDRALEERLISEHASAISNPEYMPYYTQFLRGTMDLSKSYQRRLLDGMRVSFSGVEGAFADIVARRIFPEATVVPCPDFKSAYQAVEDGHCDCVLLPIENSFNGDVGQVMDLAFFGSLHINGIYEAEIVQNLLAVKGADLSTIRTVISHPQALGQCAPYIEKHGFKTIEAVNTAVAAKEVAESGRTDIAAIASADAAARFGLINLAAHINESGINTTRFAVFSQIQKKAEESDERFVLLFTVKNVAGSLGNAISVIGSHGFNLRALKSRPTKELIWDYYFYAEGEGSLATENGEQMLLELSEHCSDLRILGSFAKEIRI